MQIRNLFLIAFQSFKIHYINSLLGFLWLPLSFLILILIKTYLFSDILNLRVGKYIPHLVTGLLFWTFLSSSITKNLHIFFNNQMILNLSINPNDFFKISFFESVFLITLNSLGHSIGLHAHTHPMLLENLSYDQQREEYQNCIISISKIIQESENSIKSMSHPCGSYNSDTLKILDNLNIDIGFKNTMLKEKKRGNGKINNSKFEIARQDHTNILKKINL